MNTPNLKVKKLPERKCLGCGEHFLKSELIRVVKTPEGTITLDLTGRVNGRGAYICKNVKCFQKARKANRFSSNLECPIPEEVYDKLEMELSNNV